MLNPAKQMKGLAAVLRHIAEEDDNACIVTLIIPLQKIKKNSILTLNIPHCSLTSILLNGGKLIFKPGILGQKILYLWH